MRPPISKIFFYDLSQIIFQQMTERAPTKAIQFMWSIIVKMLYEDIEYEDAALFVFSEILHQIIIKKRQERNTNEPEDST